MKRKLALMLSLLLVLSLCLTGCSNSITVDENGIASWKAVRGATGCEYGFVDASYTRDGFEITTDTWVQVPKGYSVHVRPILKNGEYGSWMTSEYYGVGIPTARRLPQFA